MLVLLAAAVLLLAATRTWVSGAVQDPVLGTRVQYGSGNQVVPAVTAAALVAAAAVVAAATTGRIGRLVAGLAAVLAGVLATLATLGVLRNPSAALAEMAAAGTARSSSVGTHATASGWAVLALVASLVLLAGALTMLAVHRRWNALSARYDAPAPNDARPEAAASQPRPQTGVGRSRPSDWDLLSAGDDPTEPEAPALNDPPDASRAPTTTPSTTPRTVTSTGPTTSSTTVRTAADMPPDAAPGQPRGDPAA